MIEEDYNATVRFRPEVQRLLVMAGFAPHEAEIQRIAAQLLVAHSVEERDAAYLDLMAIDKSIPGIGLHNSDERILHKREISVVYRSIFRGIQYVQMHLESLPLGWLARSIVQESCYHVESSLKHRFDVNAPLSVGMILRRVGPTGLESELADMLWLLNRSVYNEAKHTVEHLDWDSHFFSVADAIAVYFVCREIGARLLKDMDIRTVYGEPVF